MKFALFPVKINQTVKSVLLTGLCSMLVIVILGGVAIYGVRVGQTNAWIKQLDNLSLILSLQTEQAVDSAHIILETVNDHIEQLDIKDEADFRRKLSSPSSFTMLQDRKNGLDQIDVVSLIAKNGDNINFSRSYPVTGINLSERDYFQAHLKNPQLKIYISTPVRNKGNGKWTFYVTKSVRDKKGEFLGLILVGFSVDYLLNFYEKLAVNLGKDISIVLLRNDYSYLARYPFKDEIMGKQNLTGAAYEVIENQHKDNGITIINSIRMAGGPGPKRMSSVRVISRYPLISLITVPIDVVLETWYKVFIVIVGFIIVSLIAISIGMRFFMKAIQMREDGYQHLQELTTLSENANIAKSKFIATISHEIRTPLNGILGMSQLLLDKKIAAEEKDQHLKIIINSGKVLQTLLNDILDFSKIEAGKIEFANTAINPSQILDETTALYSQFAFNKNIQISFNWQGPEGLLYLTDPIRLKQILSNLTMNAIKFTDEGQVRINAREISRNDHSANLEFEIIDTGIGIKKEDIPLLFKAFSQLKSESSVYQTGTGLGLSIVGSIIDAMNGSYGVESEEGKGSTFWFRIQVEILEVGTSTDRVSSTISEANIAHFQYAGKVLIAEDNATNQLVLSEMIKSLSPHLQILIADNGQIALDVLVNNPDIDLILMDISMPIMDGLEATTEIRKIESMHHSKRVPIVAVTAFLYESDRIKFISHGMDEAIPKPIEILQLGIVLKTYLLRNSLSKIEAPLLVPEKENLLIFNQQKMLSRLNGNVQLSKKIIQSAIKEMPKFIDHLFESIQEGNLIETKNIVHTMKGLIGQVGGEQLESSLNAFDDQLRNGESLNIQDVELIDHSFKKLIDEVDRQGILDS